MSAPTLPLDKYTVQQILNSIFDESTNSLKVSVGALVGPVTITGNLTVTGDFEVDGNFIFGDASVDILTVTGTIRLANGTAAAPSLGFTNSINTGFFLSATGIMGITASGSARILISGLNTALATTVEKIGLDFSTLTKTWATGAITTQREFLFRAPTYAFAGASIVTTAATVAITGAPIVGANATFTSALAFWVQSGISQFDGVAYFANGTAVAPSLTFTSDPDTGIYNSAANTLGFAGAGVALGTWSPTTLTINQSVGASGSTPTALSLISAAHLALATTVEDSSVVFDLSASKQWTAGTVALQREFRIIPPTYTGTSAMTIASAALFSVSGPPRAGTNVTITSACSILISPITTQQSASGLNISGARFLTGTVTINGTTQITNACGVSHARFEAMTVTNVSAGLVMDTAATVYIAGSPTATGNLTITKSYALLIDAGILRINSAASGAGAIQLYDDFARFVIYKANGTLIGAFGHDGTNMFIGNTVLQVLTIDQSSVSTFAGKIVVTPSAVGGGASAFVINPAAHTAVTVQVNDFLIAARTITITGGFISQAFSLFSQPTITAASGLTVTNAATVSIIAPTVAGSALITSTSALALGSAVTASIIANIASSTFSLLNTTTQSITLSTATQITSPCAAAAGRFGIITINQSGGAVVVDAAATHYIAGAVAAGSSVTITNSYALFVDAGNTRLDGWLVNQQNSIAAANDFTPTSNTVYVTGATQINRLAAPPTSATHGATLKLIFASNPVVKHNQASGGGFFAIKLAGSADYSTAADGTLTLEWDFTNQIWQELSRKAA